MQLHGNNGGPHRCAGQDGGKDPGSGTEYGEDSGAESDGPEAFEQSHGGHGREDHQAEISKDPTRFMAITMTTAVTTARIRLYTLALVPVAEAKLSSKVTAKILW